jgi:hypothetical protein
MNPKKDRKRAQEKRMGFVNKEGSGTGERVWIAHVQVAENALVHSWTKAAAL